MLTYATEKLRSRLQKMAFDTTINKVGKKTHSSPMKCSIALATRILEYN